MHWVIDIIAALILLFYLLAGWQKGFLLSLLGIVRTVLAVSVSFFSVYACRSIEMGKGFVYQS